MFNSIINLSEKHGFVKKLVFPTLNFFQLKIGPVGNLLMHNLRNEWYNNIVINNDISMFLDEEFESTFQFGRKLCLEKLPFGICQNIVINNKRSQTVDELMETYKESDKINFEKMFDDNDKVLLKSTVFVSSNESQSFFYKWQRHRRMWWRKFSPNPGRYSLSDIKTNSNNIQTVEIVAKYPWQDEIVETLTLYPSCNNLTIKDQQFKEGKKTIQAHNVVSEVSLTSLFLNTICDAYDQSAYKGISRTLLRFHRKLAPYRISFAISTSTYSLIPELSDLALYLTKQLRANQVSTLYIPSSSKLSLEAQWRQYDEMGIPYNIILNENTLKNGICLMRSRDTTLKEQVHVADITKYVEQLFKSY